jgi:hypothetical protein
MRQPIQLNRNIAWLNDVQAFATGEPGSGGVTYKVYIPK